MEAKTEVKGLTADEAEVLQRLADGETVEEIASSWSVSGRWVRYKLMRARDRLEARTSEHAVALFVLKSHFAVNVAKSKNGHNPEPIVLGAAEERLRRVGAARQ